MPANPLAFASRSASVLQLSPSMFGSGAVGECTRSMMKVESTAPSTVAGEREGAEWAEGPLVEWSRKAQISTVEVSARNLVARSDVTVCE